VPARALEWTLVPHSSFPRNEGVPGSSPSVDFSRFAEPFVCAGNASFCSLLVRPSHLPTSFPASLTQILNDSCEEDPPKRPHLSTHATALL
jgi:hypothetical protein